ncbi:MAG: ribonuclease P protein component [Verrucomicrobia bacterium]|nr:ribonuclease P protein component [Verrucomicrobiota bacterium]
MSSTSHATPRPKSLGKQTKPVKLGLPRSSRLRSGYQHLKVRSSGLSLHGTFLRMGVMGDQVTETQGAVVVSRRVGPAVTRNKLKRRLREVYRQELSSLRTGLWIVVTVKPSASNATMESLRSEWLRLGKRLSIFSDSLPDQGA